jgi:hypothetical protein
MKTAGLGRLTDRDRRCGRLDGIRTSSVRSPVATRLGNTRLVFERAVTGAPAEGHRGGSREKAYRQRLIFNSSTSRFFYRGW